MSAVDKNFQRQIVTVMKISCNLVVNPKRVGKYSTICVQNFRPETSGELLYIVGENMFYLGVVCGRSLRKIHLIH
jgi:hypothetical protein